MALYAGVPILSAGFDKDGSEGATNAVEGPEGIFLRVGESGDDLGGGVEGL
jgi:hypothetical protein